MFQKLVHTAVTKGCSVGLKGQSGALLQKGWRIVTTHVRLAEMLHKPCRCHTSYKHGKCEGSNATLSARYTPEYARLVVEALSREGDFQRVVEECSGRSELPSGFGLGLMCTCQGGGSGTGCGSCLLGEVSAGMLCPEPATALVAGNNPALEDRARALSSDPNSCNLKDLQNLMSGMGPVDQGSSRRGRNPQEVYQVFGTYAFGNHYGLTRRTQAYPELCRYINQVLKKLMPKDMYWTSFVLRHGSHMPTHRDHNNDVQHPNGSVGFGS